MPKRVNACHWHGGRVNIGTPRAAGTPAGAMPMARQSLLGSKPIHWRGGFLIEQIF